MGERLRKPGDTSKSEKQSKIKKKKKSPLETFKMKIMSFSKRWFAWY